MDAQQEVWVARQVPPPEIPAHARPYVIEYLLWLGNDEGSHGGLFCRYDREEMIAHADRLADQGEVR